MKVKKQAFGESKIVAYTGGLIRWRWAVIALTLAATIAVASGGRFLSFSTDYRDFFGDDNPQLLAYEEVRNVYSKSDNVLFVLKPESGDAFQPGFLAALRDLTGAAWRIPYATRVDSPTNFQHSYAEGDDLTVRDLVPKNARLTPGEVEQIRAVALSDPLLVKRLVSADGSTVGVNVTVTLPLKSPEEVPAVMAHVEKLAEDFRAAHPGVRMGVTGMVPISNAFFSAAENDMATLMPIMFGVLLLVTILMLRSFAGTFATLAVIGFSTIAAMGAAGWMGVALTPISANAPTIILTIAIADSIHLLLTIVQQMRHGASKFEAITESMRINFQPVFLTSLTTVIGFLSLNFSDSPPFHDLGNISAIGVVAAWAYSVVFLPALVAVLPLRIRPTEKTGSDAMKRLAEFVIRKPRSVLVVTAALVVGLVSAVPTMEINDEFVSYFGRSMEFRTDTDFAAENLSGMYQLEWSVPAGNSGGVNDPEFLRTLEAYATWLRGQPEVVHVLTISDVFKRLNKNLHSDDPAYYRLPEDRELAAQYLLLYEMSLPFGLDLNDQISVDKSATRVIATTQNITTNQLRALDDKAAAWFRRHDPAAGAVEATGPAVMFAYITQRNIEGMLTGTLLAFLLISGTLMLALRSLKLGLLSLAPNLIPALMAFGVWALLVGQLGLSASFVAAMSLGLIVDATVHFLSKYRRARREHRSSVEDSIRYAFQTVGMAILATSLILVAGFSVLAFSPFKLNHNLGLLTAIAIALALVTDFLLLPTLLLLLDRSKQPGETPAVAKPPSNLATIGSAAMNFQRYLLIPLFIAGALALLTALPQYAGAKSPQARGLEVAKELDRRDLGWRDSKVKFKMVLANQQGQTSTRELRITSLEVPDPNKGDKSLVYFYRPRDVRGTAFLTHTRITEADDQWLFLPALKRVKRISSANKSGPFMGSEFAYEDLGSQEVGKYSYRWLRDEPCGELTCFVVQRVPAYENSGYVRQIVWVDQAHYRPMRIEYYDRKNALLKTLVFKSYRQYLGKYWRAQTMSMSNHQTGKTTELIFDAYRFRAGVSARNFKPSRLKTVR